MKKTKDVNTADVIVAVILAVIAVGVLTWYMWAINNRPAPKSYITERMPATAPKGVIIIETSSSRISAVAGAAIRGIRREGYSSGTTLRILVEPPPQ